jgi:hypothetical protein
MLVASIGLIKSHQTRRIEIRHPVREMVDDCA